MSAAEPCFVDTNVWLYAFIAGQDAAKHAQAQQLIQRPGIVVSVQVINEVCVNLLRKANYPEPELRKLIASFYAKYQVASVGEQALIHASDLRDRYSLSFWTACLSRPRLNRRFRFCTPNTSSMGYPWTESQRLPIRLWRTRRVPYPSRRRSGFRTGSR